MMEEAKDGITEALPREFFHGSAVNCARRLLGCRLLWGSCAGVIVETEAYEEFGDEACHTASRPTARKFLAEHPAGSAYVYFNYGMHWMLNVSTAGNRGKGFVLLRALEPTAGLRWMRRRRMAGKVKETPEGIAWLCSGPGKLACALGVEKRHHGLDLCAGTKAVFLSPTQKVPRKATPRIGISKAVDLPWRFVWDGHPCLSRA
jgi:DNA-3-methyladenine glycosylase